MNNKEIFAEHAIGINKFNRRRNKMTLEELRRKLDDAQQITHLVDLEVEFAEEFISK